MERTCEMIENIQKFFGKKQKVKSYGYGSEYIEKDTSFEAEDYFMEESYMNSLEAEDEFFD